MRWWISGAAALVGVLLLGAMHIVHGGATGIHMCWKDGWTFSDTFIDLEELRGNKRYPLKVFSALDKCHL